MTGYPSSELKLGVSKMKLSSEDRDLFIKDLRLINDLHSEMLQYLKYMEYFDTMGAFQIRAIDEGLRLKMSRVLHVIANWMIV